MFLQVLLAGFAVSQVGNTACDENVEIDPVDLYYYCEHRYKLRSEYDKTPILFLHRLTSSNMAWRNMLEEIALLTNRRVCAMDLRNHGASPRSNQTDVLAMAVDIGHYLDMHNIQKATLIGHSFGGKVALHYALNNPHRVDSLIVEDILPNCLQKCGFNGMIISLKMMLDAIDSVPGGSTKKEAKNITKEFLNKRLSEIGWPTIDDYSADILQIRCINGTCEFKTYRPLMQKVVDDPLSIWTESKGLYKGPTLFIYGTKSPMGVAADEKSIKELFPNAEIFGVEGAGHDIHTAFKWEFLVKVISFLVK